MDGFETGLLANCGHLSSVHACLFFSLAVVLLSYFSPCKSILYTDKVFSLYLFPTFIPFPLPVSYLFHLPRSPPAAFSLCLSFLSFVHPSSILSLSSSPSPSLPFLSSPPFIFLHHSPFLLSFPTLPTHPTSLSCFSPSLPYLYFPPSLLTLFSLSLNTPQNITSSCQFAHFLPAFRVQSRSRVVSCRE